MYHIRSQISPEQRYRAEMNRAWRSLFVGAGACAGALAVALFSQVPPKTGAGGGVAPQICAWVQETTPTPAAAPKSRAFSLPPLPDSDIPTPMPAACLSLTAKNDFSLFPLSTTEPTATQPLLPAPDSLGESPRPPVAHQRPVSTAGQAGRQTDTTPPAYRSTPVPPYPPTMRAERTEGCVGVRIAVDAAGKPTQVDITRSSGHREFDTTARDWILRCWLFTPALSSGKPIAGVVSTSIRFVLD